MPSVQKVKNSNVEKLSGSVDKQMPGDIMTLFRCEH